MQITDLRTTDSTRKLYCGKMAAYGDVLDAAVGHLVNIYIYGHCVFKVRYITAVSESVFPSPIL